MKDNEQKPTNRDFSRKSTLGLGLELGYIIALPVVVFGLFGKWLDSKLGTEPIFVLIGVLTAIVSTTVWIYRKFKKYF